MEPFFGGYHPLSNFHIARFVIDGVEYNCVEQYYQASKARHFKNDASRIMHACEPRIQKQYGRQIKGFSKREWLRVCDRYMWRALKAKFEQNDCLSCYLKQTANKTLVEASPYDTYWGAGKSAAALNADSAFSGQNRLGRMLMTLRSLLQ